MKVLVPGPSGPEPEDRVSAYLDVLEVAQPRRADLPTLRTLHRAHVEKVPWSSIDLVLGWDAPTDEASCVRRVVGRRAGFGFHLNGAFGWLLERLGYAVSRHRAGVHRRLAWDAAGADGSHLGLTVDLGWRGRWLVDVGLGSVQREPVRLVEGEIVDGPFQLRLSRSAVLVDGWRLEHDPRDGSFVAMELDARPVDLTEAAARGQELAGPGSPLAQELVVHRRDATGIDHLLGTRLWRVEGDRRRMRLLSTPRALRGVLAQRFNLDLDALGVGPRELDMLFLRDRPTERLR